MRRLRPIRLILISIALLLLYVMGVIVRGKYGIGVFVQNESGALLREVRVRVDTKGNLHPLPDLPTGRRARVFIRPRGDSDFKLEFTDIAGVQHTELIVRYVESDYCGNAKVTVLPGNQVVSKEDISLIACTKSWLAFF